METRIYEELNDDIRMVRQTVFVEEQGFQNEFDQLDDISVHIVAYDNGNPVGNIRFEDQTIPGAWHIGRVCVLKEARGKGIGALLLNAAEFEILLRGGHLIRLFAQADKQKFYEKLGYVFTGNTMDDEGVPHVEMEKRI